eukprot:768080-Hanusia_phi.AAC.2
MCTLPLVGTADFMCAITTPTTPRSRRPHVFLEYTSPTTLAPTKLVYPYPCKCFTPPPVHPLTSILLRPPWLHCLPWHPLPQCRSASGKAWRAGSQGAKTDEQQGRRIQMERQFGWFRATDEDTARRTSRERGLMG